MKKVFFRYIALCAVIMLVSLAACSPAAVKTAEPPSPTAALLVVKPTLEPTPAPTATPEKPKNLVSSLDEVKNATIQIEAQGTFQDPAVGLVVNGAGRGSGFIIDSSGIAVTNNHVVTGAALLKVWVGGNKDRVYNARVLGASECSDLAVIKIDGGDFPYLQWHEGAPKVGLEVYAAGYPLGDPEFTLTKGIVSKANADGKTSWASVGSVLEHDARINPGNSGGPLVDAKGTVVGINYANNSSGQYFAIARSEADSVVTQLQKGTDINSIGVNGQTVMSEDNSLSGIWVSSIKSGSAADKSGLKSGDIITQIEGLVLGTDGTMSDYCQILRSHNASDTLTLNVLRWQTQELLEGQLNGRELKVTASYGAGPQASTGQSNTSSSGVVSDDSKTISMEIPEGWEYNGNPWDDTWTVGNTAYNFTAQTLTASSDVAAYSSGWGTPGIFIATSEDWGQIGGYANLLEGVAGFYSDCRTNGGQKYKDEVFEGQMRLYTKCGADKGEALVMAVRPIRNSQAYLVLIELKYKTQEDLDILDAILTSADINN